MSGAAERGSRARTMRSHQSAERSAPGQTADLAVLGALVRQLRTERQLSTRALAKRSMCARSTIQRLERGLLRPRPSLLTWVANGLDPDRQRELRAAMISAAGGADALADDGKWAHRRSQQAPKGWLTGDVPLPSDLAHRIALHNKATALRQQAHTILDRPGALDDGAALDAATALLDESRSARDQAGGLISIWYGRRHVTYGLDL